MAWPTIGEYNAAFARPAEGLVAPSLEGARTRPGPLGSPLPLSGGFAFIYDVTLPGGKRKAVRCFSEDDPRRRARARAACTRLEDCLSSMPALRPWFAAAHWEERCVRAGGQVLPAIVMDWVEGQTLGQYIEARHDDGSALASLRERLAEMAGTLARHGIVHGDLQTGNIVVTVHGGVVLIDYDGLSFAGEEEGEELETGHVNFQHPAFASESLPALKDRFPAIGIDLGLAALIARPELFGRFSTGENILFVREDYLSPGESPAFEAIRRAPGLAYATGLFEGLCVGAPEHLPSLEEFRAEAYREGGATHTAPVSGIAPRPPRRKAPAKGPYAGPYEVHDCTDFAGILAAVGRRLEVVGRVESVKADGLTKHGKPFVFVNFGDWRMDCFKLTIWSEGLESFAEAPDDSWEGRWISAVGLIDEPYRGKSGKGSTQVSITIQDSSQVRFITEAEARYRLGGPAPRTMTHTLEADESVDDDQLIMSHNVSSFMAAQGAPRVAPRAPARRPAGTPSNTELLERLLKNTSAASPPPTTPAASALSVRRPSPAPAAGTPAAGTPATGRGWLSVVVWIAVILVVLALMGAF